MKESMRKYSRRPLIAVAMLIIAALVGCVYEPLEEDLHTRNVYPITTNTYSVGSLAQRYLNGYFQNVYVNGSLQTGDAANYSLFGADGTQTMVGTARTINSIWVAAGGIKAPGTKPATAISHGALELPAWQFANQALVANQESVSFTMRIPERMDRSAAPTITVGWSTTTTDPGDDTIQVKWQLEYLWTSVDESTIAAAQETLTVLTSASTVAEGLRVSTFTGIDLPSGTDVCIHCKVTRLSADVTDTVADNVELVGSCMRWTSNKLGG